MTQTAFVLFPILIVDVLNPVLFAFMVYATGSKRPMLNSLALLAGHTAAYFTAGIVVALGLERIAHYLANPGTIDYVIGLVVGILLIWVAIPKSKKALQKKPEETGELTPLSAFGIGAVVNFIGIPFALPYFAAIDQILKANLPVTESVILLIGYNIAYAVPFLMVPALVAMLGAASQPILERINGWLDKASAVLMPILLGLVGLALVADALLYFATGQGLF